MVTRVATATATPLPRARLRRRNEHRLIAGLAGGLADWLNAPVAFVRILLLVATAVAPWLPALYAAVALVLPARGRNRPDWDNVVGVARLGLVFAVAKLVTPTPFYSDEPIHGSIGWWVAFAGLLVAGAAALLSADYRRGRPRTSREARTTVLAALPVAAAVLALALGVVLVPEVRWEPFLPLAALIGAVALLAAGGKRAFVAPALLALALAGLIIPANARLEGGVGTVRLVPSPPDDGRIEIRRAVGSVNIDLKRLAHAQRPTTVEASVGIGELRVSLPQGAWATLDARVGRGAIEQRLIDLDSPMQQGFDQRETGRFRPRGRETAAPIRLVLDVGMGAVDIHRQGFIATTEPRGHRDRHE